MLGTIRKHQTWLWAVIIVVTVASFVVFGPTNTKIGNALKGGEPNYGIIGGQPITREEISRAGREIELEGYLQSQQWPDPNAPETIRQTYLRMFLIRKQKQYGINISTEAAASYAQRILGGAPLSDFADRFLKPAGLTPADFDRFLRHKLGIEQLAMAAGVSGKLVTPQEAETMYRLEHQEMESSLAYFGATNFMSSVQVTPEALMQFYTNQVANYRVPDQVQVRYVKFNVTNYFPAAQTAMTNLDQQVEAAMQQLGTNLFHGAKTEEESKAAVRSEILRRHALIDARRAAGDFATALDAIQPHTLENFEKFAASNNLVVHTTAPFDREYGPQDITVPQGFAQRAFSLAMDDPFAGPIPAEDGVYEIALDQKLPSETPRLSKISEKVTADYRFINAVQLAQQAAVKFGSTLSNGLAAGKSFEAVCAEAGVKPVSLPPFSLSTRSLPEEIENKISIGMLKQAAFTTLPGKASAVAGTRDGAFIIYVAKQLPIDDVKMKAEMPQFLAFLRSTRLNDAFNQWFNVEINQDPEFLQYIQHLTSDSQMKSSSARRPKS